MYQRLGVGAQVHLHSARKYLLRLCLMCAMCDACRDIPARYLLRLGMGERDLDVDDDFSRAGRVNNMLARRLTLLAEVSLPVLCRSVGQHLSETLLAVVVEVTGF